MEKPLANHMIRLLGMRANFPDSRCIITVNTITERQAVVQLRKCQIINYAPIPAQDPIQSQNTHNVVRRHGFATMPAGSVLFKAW